MNNTHTKTWWVTRVMQMKEWTEVFFKEARWYNAADESVAAVPHTKGSYFMAVGEGRATVRWSDPPREFKPGEHYDLSFGFVGDPIEELDTVQ